MRACCIVGAGEISTELLAESLLRDSFIIAADGGMKALNLIGVPADLFIGDGDSLVTFADMDDINADEIILLPAEKDVTDMQAALDYAISHGYNYVRMFGATGGRFDHYFANIGLLEHAFRRGIHAEIRDAKNLIMIYPGRTIELLRDPEYKYLSILPLDYKISGVSIKGVKYPLKNANLTRSTPLAVSNEIVSERAKIFIRNGRALIVMSR